jgi:hypothetical protein
LFAMREQVHDRVPSELHLRVEARPSRHHESIPCALRRRRQRATPCAIASSGGWSRDRSGASECAGRRRHRRCCNGWTSGAELTPNTIFSAMPSIARAFRVSCGPPPTSRRRTCGSRSNRRQRLDGDRAFVA